MRWLVKTENQEEKSSMVQATKDLNGLPVMGQHSGPGPHVPMPSQVTDDDLMSGQPHKYIGWTCYGLDHEASMVITGENKSAILLGVDPHARAAVARSKRLPSEETQPPP